MPNLVTLANARSALNKMDIPDVNTALDHALGVVSSLLASKLGIPTFSSVTQTDLFMVIVAHVNLHDGVPLKMKLSRMFLDEGEDLTISWAARVTDTFEAQTTTEHTLNDVKGYLSLYNPQIVTGVLKVEYTAGFNAIADGSTQVYENVPDWLRSVALITLTAIFDILRFTNTDQEGQATKRSSPAVPPTAMELLAPYLRTLQDCLNPTE